MARAAKTEREIELEEAIVEAVANLDECDGSRVSTSEAIDTARDVLKEAYGTGFEKDVSDFLETEDDENLSDESDDLEDED